MQKKDFEFVVGDKLFLKVTSSKNVVRFGRKGKPAFIFIGPFEILERIGKVAYCLALLANMDCIHNMFHVLLLHKYIEDPS